MTKNVMFFSNAVLHFLQSMLLALLFAIKLTAQTNISVTYNMLQKCAFLKLTRTLHFDENL